LRGHGARPNRLRVSGGLARLGLINEIKADVTGLPTEVVAEFETTAIGAMMIAGTGCGWFDSLSQATEVVRIREIIVPDRTRHEVYGEWFGLYQRLYGALRESFVERTAIAQKVGLGGVGRLENL
jgi:xylulokinase